MKKGYVYFIHNKLTDAYYVGATVNYLRRIRQHLCKSRYTHGWHKDFQENTENYETGILEIISAKTDMKLSEKLCERENYYYEKFRATKKMYNILKPQRSYMIGQKFTPERIEKHRECHYGKEHTTSPNWDKLAENKQILLNYLYKNRVKK